MINMKNCSLKRALLFYVHSYTRCYGRLKYGKIQRTNGIQNIMYFTRVVTNERKFSWRGKIGSFGANKKKVEFLLLSLDS